MTQRKEPLSEDRDLVSEPYIKPLVGSDAVETTIKIANFAAFGGPRGKFSHTTGNNGVDRNYSDYTNWTSVTSTNSFSTVMNAQASNAFIRAGSNIWAFASNPTTTTTVDFTGYFEGLGFDSYENGGSYYGTLTYENGSTKFDINPPTTVTTSIEITTANSYWAILTFNMSGVQVPDFGRTWDTGAGEPRNILPNPGHSIYPRFIYDKSWKSSFNIAARNGANLDVSGTIGFTQLKILDTSNTW